jgi:hypothetical protein
LRESVGQFKTLLTIPGLSAGSENSIAAAMVCLRGLRLGPE